MRALATILTLIAFAARAETVTIPGPGGIALKAELVLPAGDPRGPAVVALHGCGGPFPSRDRQWAERLAGAGHPVLFPDSFGSRGLGPQCRNRDRTVTASGLRREDALAAAKWLAAQPFTPPGGVVLMGWSNGASTVLAAGRASREAPPGLIRALVAFYPGCRVFAKQADWRPAAPLLILIGESDDWTPAAPCRELAARWPKLITLVTYPGAYHDFDAPGRPVKQRHGVAYSANGSGTVHAGTNPAARQDALRRVPEFLQSIQPAPATP